MVNNVNSILKEVLLEIKPSEKEMKEIEGILKDYLQKVKTNLKKKKINADIFVGGSFAKKTMMKRDLYDIDIFIRFDKKYKNELLSDITEKVLSGVGTRATRIHGSRDYFNIKVKENLLFEIVPVKKISKPGEAENVTDLSYSHVNYIRKKIKSEKILDEIRLAKAFCHANGAYGAESYINGFSGYGLELLVYHHKSFLKFLKSIIKVNKDKPVIDLEKHHKSKSRILMDLNEAKLKSPIVLVDPTYKQRNVLAALSEETFRNFQNVCKEFLRKPRREFFIPKTANIEKIRQDAKKRGLDFVAIEIKTEKQEGDIAGSKLLKFYKHLIVEAGKFFEIKEKGFEYIGKQTGIAFIVGKKKPFILIMGPEVHDKENSSRFRAKHRTISIKNGRVYAKETIQKDFTGFLEQCKVKNIFKIREMGINGLEFNFK